MITEWKLTKRYEKKIHEKKEEEEKLLIDEHALVNECHVCYFNLI